jgi:hypothetical protein
LIYKNAHGVDSQVRASIQLVKRTNEFESAKVYTTWCSWSSSGVTAADKLQGLVKEPGASVNYGAPTISRKG